MISEFFLGGKSLSGNVDPLGLAIFNAQNLNSLFKPRT
jgi:hypothetical protein